MPRLFSLLAVFWLAALPAPARAFDKVQDKKAFLSLMQGRELWLGLFRVSLQVLPDGKITGSALGTPVAGTWNWRDGYFCRQLTWRSREIGFNCQLVEAKGTQQMRFTVDRGAGNSATFRLR